MPISASTLSALQKLGAAAFNADEKLKNEVAAYAQRANAAIFNNPYNLGNAALIESWQVAARLSKKLSGIEEELRELYRIAGELTEEDLPIVRETRALSAPTSASSKKAAKQTATKTVDLSATTVKVKKASKNQVPKASATVPATKGKKTVAKPLAAKKGVAPTALPTKPVKKTPVAKTKTEVATPASAPAKAKTKPIAKGTKVKATSAAASSQELTGNPAKLLAHLQTILNAEAFEHLNQTVVAKDAGIPLGSMSATLGRLTKARRLVAGPQGSYKLAKVAVKAAEKSPAPAKTPASASTTAPAPTPTKPEVQAAATPETQA
jgi:hypothetical protein